MAEVGGSSPTELVLPHQTNPEPAPPPPAPPPPEAPPPPVTSDQKSTRHNAVT